MLDGLKLLKELRQQIEAAEAGEKLAELNAPLKDPVQYARDELEKSGIIIVHTQVHYFTDVFWTRTGALGIRKDMHKLNLVLVKLPDGKHELRCGFGYKEAIAVHGEVLCEDEAFLRMIDYKP